MNVEGGRNRITITFDDKIAGDVYAVRISGPIAVPINTTVTLDSNGKANVAISPLQAGTYDVKITRNADGRVTDFPDIAVTAGGPVPEPEYVEKG